MTVSPEQRIADLLDEIVAADEAGVDTFGIGEHHRAEFLDSAPVALLAAAAARTKRIRLTSAVTVLSADDPVRVFEAFATVDLISRGRVELVVGRGSFVDAFPLYGLDLADYDSLFTEKLELLLQIRDDPNPHWRGRHRAALTGQGVYPRPVQQPLPVWVGVGGTPESFARAGLLGLPLMVAIIGGEPRRFAPLIDLYREAGRQAGHPAEQLKVGLHCFGYLAEDSRTAADEFWPGWAEMFTRIGAERGGSAPTRPQFEATRGPHGAYFIGDPDEVARKIVATSRELGGIDRLTMQMTNLQVPHDRLMSSIRLLGTRVAPAVRAALGDR